MFPDCVFRVALTASLLLSSLPLRGSAGHISAQRVALQTRQSGRKAGVSVDSFMEELVVRRELTDNFCFYNKNYDSVKGQSRAESPDTDCPVVFVFTHLYICLFFQPLRRLRVGSEDLKRSRQRQEGVHLHTGAAGEGKDA